MLEVYIASAFSKNGSGGNKAGVVLRDMGLTSEEKQKIASVLGYSETAFLSPSEQADYRIEYFTPKGEVPLCGHATVALFTVLKSLGQLEKTQYTIETKAGRLNICIAEDGMIFMEQNPPEYGEILQQEELAVCLDARAFSQEYPIQIVSTGLRDIMLPVRSAEEMKALEPDFPAMKDLSRQKNVIGVHAFTLENKAERTAVCRNFAPLYGIDEESATGTSNCALACYLYRLGCRRQQYVFEQGHNLGEISRIVVRLIADEESITAVMVGGDGYLLDKRQIEF